VNRQPYQRAAIDLYLEAPGTPDRANRRDWAIAGELHRRMVPLERLAHAIRLASVRRLATGLDNDRPSVNSLAYYRAVVERLSPQDCSQEYVAYIGAKYEVILERTRSRTATTKSAVSQP
jgi:hypothetical protein